MLKIPVSCQGWAGCFSSTSLTLGALCSCHHQDLPWGWDVQGEASAGMDRTPQGRCSISVSMQHGWTSLHGGLVFSSLSRPSLGLAQCYQIKSLVSPDKRGRKLSPTFWWEKWQKKKKKKSLVIFSSTAVSFLWLLCFWLPWVCSKCPEKIIFDFHGHSTFSQSSGTCWYCFCLPVLCRAMNK